MYLLTKEGVVHNDIERPNHYDKAGVDIRVEPKDLVRLLGFDLGNVCKYLFRYKWKNGQQDLDKAREYLSWIRSDSSCILHVDPKTGMTIYFLTKIFLMDKAKYHPALVRILQGLHDGCNEYFNLFDCVAAVSDAFRILNKDKKNETTAAS